MKKTFGNLRGFLKKNKLSTPAEDAESSLREALREKIHSTAFDGLSPYRLDVKGIYSRFDEEAFARRKKNFFCGE